jgi:hypothetical protein
VTSRRGLCRSNLLSSFLGYVPSVPATGGGDDGLTWYQYWFWWWAGHAHEEGKLYAMESRLGHARFCLCEKSTTALVGSFSHCRGSSLLPPYGCHPPSIAQRTLTDLTPTSNSRKLVFALFLLLRIFISRVTESSITSGEERGRSLAA